ncbi:hypothetical protein [Blastomonas sp.]|uniref:hypothetical protein n=1 Tax=Blastomonas sp. TaxID=1909299 RepID=UPI00359317CF
MIRFFGGVNINVAVSACALAAMSFGVASCGPAEHDPGPGGVTVGEAEALDEAAEMLDERNADPSSAPESAPASATPDQ